jgi:hypothetical protein
MAYPKGRVYIDKISFVAEKGTKQRIKEKVKKLSEKSPITMSDWLRLLVEQGLNE